jgi:hypothetical protein
MAFHTTPARKKRGKTAKIASRKNENPAESMRRKTLFYVFSDS